MFVLCMKDLILGLVFSDIVVLYGDKLNCENGIRFDRVIAMNFCLFFWNKVYV